MPKLKLTVELVYEATPEDYGTDDVQKMIDIDLEDQAALILSVAHDGDAKVTLEEVMEGSDA